MTLKKAKLKVGDIFCYPPYRDGRGWRVIEFVKRGAIAEHRDGGHKASLRMGHGGNSPVSPTVNISSFALAFKRARGIFLP